MYHTLLVLHFLALAMAMGGGLSNIIAKRQMPKAPPVTYPGFALASGAVGKMATLALAVLWVTGLWMGLLKFGGFGGFPALLWVKLALVTVLTGFSGSLNHLIIRARRAGTPPDGQKIDRHAYAISGLAVLIVIVAVVLFN
jgi:hypothetical protein